MPFVLDNSVVTQKGSIESKEVVTMLGKYHVFLFPTLGENFGHVILEAMTAGCAILISDATPWRGLQEKGYGWELPLSRPESFVAALNEAVRWDAARFAEVSAAARTAAAAYLEHAGNVEANRNMFAAMVNLSSDSGPLPRP
jgi:glycosyltransferase involved in cell wall biosynthesis